MRADRLLSLLLLLQQRGGMSAAALARELEVSPRTVQRDIDALSAAGVPVYAERGRTGGYRLLDRFSTDLTGLTHDESLALLVAGSRARTESLGMAPALASAMRKVVSALPDTHRDTATRAAQRLHAEPGGYWRTGQEEPHLGVLQQATITGHRLRIRYGSRWRTVDPVGLVHAGGRWYLLARRDGADRTYRVSRVQDAQELPEPADRADTVDLAAVWRARRDAFVAGRSPVRVTVRVRARRRTDLVRAAMDHGADRPDRGGWLLLDLDFGDMAHAEGVLWSLGADAEALEPAELRARLATRAAATADRYASEVPSGWVPRG